MAEKYFPFNSVSGDREYLAEDFAAYFADIISSGVSANGDNLGVTAAGGLALSVGSGFAWIKGHLYQNTGAVALAVAAGSASPRIDRVVARLDVSARKILLAVVTGTAATTPSPPALTRNDDYFEIGLAEIAVAASAISILQTNITDTRTDNDVCGVVRCAVDNLDVGAFMAASEASFDEWFANLQYVLDGDVAGHLQNEIDNIRADLDDGVYSTTAILNVKTVPAAAVTITLGTTTLTATANSSGLAILYPSKLGSWAATVVTANGTYTGTIEVTAIGILNAALPTLSQMAWADINAVGQAGIASTIFQIGDTKNVTLGSETVTLRIEDFNHDDLSAGGKAKITFGMKNLLATTYNMNATDTNAGGWSSSAMRTRMSTFLNQLPADLKAIIKPVIKKGTAGSQSTTIQNTTDSLWLFSAKELGLLTTDAGYTGEGTQYPAFVDNTSRIKYLSNGAGAAQYYWTRSPNTGTATYFIYVTTSGANNNSYASNSCGVCLGLCV